MANGLPKEVASFKDTYKIDGDELWEVQRGTWAVHHKALERVATEQGITFDPPVVATRDWLNEGICVLVTGRRGERVEWSFGEAARHNLKQRKTRQGEDVAVYPWAMAEKRAKDRVILKLLNAHGNIYSNEEGDDFAKRQNPHVTTPTDIIGEPIEYDEQGNPVDNIPNGDPSIATLAKKDARKDYETAQKEMRACQTVAALQAWGEANRNRIASYPPDWAEIFRGLYRDHQDSLRAGKAA